MSSLDTTLPNFPFMGTLIVVSVVYGITLMIDWESPSDYGVLTWAISRGFEFHTLSSKTIILLCFIFLRVNQIYLQVHEIFGAI